jgi:hypothetical protein
MATVLKFHRPHPPKSGANRSRPTASHILTNVAALLSRVERLEIQTTEDLRESFFILDLANMCIRLFIGQIDSGAARKQLLSHSARIDQLIEAARSEAAHLF